MSIQSSSSPITSSPPQPSISLSSLTPPSSSPPPSSTSMSSPDLSIPTFHLLSDESRSRSRSPPIRRSRLKGRARYPTPSSTTSDTDPTWKFRKRYGDEAYFENSEFESESEEGEGEEVTSDYDPKKLVCTDYIFLDNLPPIPIDLPSCGSLACPICTPDEGAASLRRVGGGTTPRKNSISLNAFAAKRARVGGSSTSNTSAGGSLRSNGRAAETLRSNGWNVGEEDSKDMSSIFSFNK